jgi:TonB-dependent receptor
MITQRRFLAGTSCLNRPVSTLILVIAASSFAVPAYAQSPGTPAAAQVQRTAGLEEIVVTGQRRSQANAVTRQRDSLPFVSALSADDVGNFPDQNVAEATRRLPGVSVENDQGEGRFVILRGLDPNLNVTTVNGLTLPSPQRDGGRQVALDTIPAELLSGMVVQKTFTPDMDGDAIGGTVEIETMSAFDHDGPWVTGRIEGQYNRLQGEYSPRVSLAGSNRLAGDRLGIAAAVGWFDRKFGSENIEVDAGWRTAANGAAFAVEPEQRDYIITRERLGFAGNVDFRATDSLSLFFRGLYTDFSDLEYRSRNEFLARNAPISASNESSRFNDRIRIDRDSKDRVQAQDILSLQTGAEFTGDVWEMGVTLGYARATEDEVDRLDSEFRREFRTADVPGGFLFDFNYNDRRRLGIAGANAASQAAITNPALFPLTRISLTDNTLDDEEWSGRIDIERATAFGEADGFIKFGGKVKLREKTNNQDVRRLTTFGASPDGDAYNLADFLWSIDYDLGTFGPAANPLTLRPFFNQRRGNAVIDTFASFSGDYTAKEDVYAGYGMAQFDNGTLAVTGGVRIEHTKFSSTGFRVDPTTRSIAGENSYTDILPSANIRYSIGENWALRGAVSRSIARPLIDQAVSRFVVEDGNAFIGNPDLQPYEAWNFDAVVEYYPTSFNVISAALFHKRIGNYIVEIDRAGEPGFTGFGSAIRPENGERATITGLEINLQQTFDFLPAPFDGFLVQANYTFVDGKAKLDGGREIALPKQSRHLANIALGYEKGGFSIRVAAAHRSKYLDIINHLGVSDRFIQSHWQIDASAKYRLNEHVEFYTEASNLNDRPQVATFADPGQLSQYEVYDYSIALGVRLTF